MAVDSCNASVLPELAAAVCLVVVCAVAACAVLAFAVRCRVAFAPLAPGGGAVESVPAGTTGAGRAAPDGTNAHRKPANVGGAAVDEVGSTSGHKAGQGASGDVLVKEEASSSSDTPVAPPPLVVPSVLLDQGSISALRHKLCRECPMEVSCFQSRLFEAFRDVRWGCFTRQGLIKRCLAGLGCPHCEELGPTPVELVHFKNLIPHMVSIFWLDCYNESISEKHNICSEHSEDALKDERRRRTHPLIH